MKIANIIKNFSTKEKILFIIYSLVILSLFLYSFVQIDLGLVIARYPALYQIEKVFQHIGYFERPLSTYLFTALLVLLYGFYVFFLWCVYKKTISKKFVWSLIFVVTILLTFSYNAFSYDLFNYIFDARIVTHYHQNPYVHKALDYPHDPMLGFMRWTHRVYPYGPVWLALTVPLSFFGFQFFLPTFFLFKTLAGLSFLGSVYYIGKILQKIFPERELGALVFFGLNPLVFIESVVSGHLDIVMIFFCLLSIYFLLGKKYSTAVLFFLLSIGIKFVTGFILPVYIWIIMMIVGKKKITWDIAFIFCTGLLLLATYIASTRSNFQPWYLLEPLAFAAFLGLRYTIIVPSIIISLFAMFTYIPFFYNGNWDKPIPQILNEIYIASYILSVVLVGFVYVLKRIKKHVAKIKVNYMKINN